MCGNKILPRSRLASLGSRSNAVAAQNVSHRLIGQAVTQIGQSSDDAVISPAGVLSRHSHHQGFHFRSNRRAARILPMFGAIELLGDEPSIPGQDGVGFGDTGDRSECFSSQAFPDLGEWRARDRSTAISMADSPSQYGSLPSDIHSAGEAPGSRTPEAAPTCCSSWRLPIILCGERFGILTIRGQ